MSKQNEARIRDSLLQQLYVSVLRCHLSGAADGVRVEEAAVAAGVHANLTNADTLLLAPRQGASFRVLRDLPTKATASGAGDRKARVYTLPADVAQAVSYLLATALTVQQREDGSVVCVVLPRGIPSALSPQTRRGVFPRTWQDAAEYAAALALPILFVSLKGAAGRIAANPHQPAPRYPSVPVDADDALAAYRVAFECLARARMHGGPSQLAAVRLADEPGPLDRLEAALRRRNCFTKAWQRAQERAVVAALASGPD